MRSLTRAVTIGVMLAMLLPGSSSAATKRIAELNFVFAPDPASVQLGDTVTWQNQVGILHTSTDQSALLLWDSGDMGPNATFSYTVTAAGTYPYFCQLHERFGMFGTLLVKDLASPPDGPAGTVFTIEVATQPAPSGFVYDVQKRDPQGIFQAWISGTDGSVTFDSTGQPAGVYRFRSRLHRVSDNAKTVYSPPTGIQVTG
jgi:plastocyanin